MFPENFQHILRVMNTNLEGQRKIMYSLTAIKGCGRRYANLCCKKAEIDLAKRAGELVRSCQKSVIAWGVFFFFTEQPRLCPL